MSKTTVFHAIAQAALNVGNVQKDRVKGLPYAVISDAAIVAAAKPELLAAGTDDRSDGRRRHCNETCGKMIASSNGDLPGDARRERYARRHSVGRRGDGHQRQSRRQGVDDGA